MKKRFFDSLKAQLPLSFATITLVTTTMIGVVLYFIIWNYYTNLEARYLNSNVEGIANNLTRIAENSDINVENSLTDFQDVFKNQAKVTAFLIQSRIKIMDSDYQVITDSGSPSESWSITMPARRRDENDQPQNNDQTPENGQSPNDGLDDGSSVPSEASSEDNSSTSEENQDSSSSFSLEPSDGQQGGNENPHPYSFQANPNMFGFQLMRDATNEFNRRSAIVVEKAFYDKDGNLLGYVEISESPDYGRGIIQNVVRGWATASLVGIVVSLTFGFIMSRYLNRPLVNLEKVASEMKVGNYEIRSPIYKPNELASLSDTFNQMAAQIQNHIETLRHFVSDAAHEIRTPLTSLRADLNLALNEKTIKKMRPMVERSLEQVNRLDQLAKNLLDLSRLESNDEKIVMKKVNLSDKILEICEIHASAAEQADIDFQVQVPNGSVFINADAHQFQQAVGNLLNNAVKFSPAGGKVTLKMYRESQSAMILVEDDGIGIPLAERDKLFNRFHRGKNTQSYPGSGLGLAISRAIIERHKGDIGILPDKKKTIFFIRVPLAKESQPKSSRRSARKPAQDKRDTPARQ